MPTRDDEIIFICGSRDDADILNDTIMPFTTAFFDIDNTIIVPRKDYINWERHDFIIFDGD